MKIFKQIIKLFLYALLSVGRFIFPYKFSLVIDLYRNKIYTYWISTEFKKFGKGSILKHGIILVGGKYISIGRNVKIGKRTTLSAWEKFEYNIHTPEIRIGDNVEIGDDAHISALNKIVVGKNVLIGKKVTIVDNSHGKVELKSLSISPAKRDLYSSGPVIIENGVWIGDKVTILSNVHIGENAIIGSNAVVTHDVPANSVFGGVPARIIKYII